MMLYKKIMSKPQLKRGGEKVQQREQKPTAKDVEPLLFFQD